MAQVTVMVNGRPYQVGCEDGAEEHVSELAGFIDTHVQTLVKEVGQVGEARLLLMTAMLIADEMSNIFRERDDLKAELDEAVDRIAQLAAKLQTA